MESLLQVLFIIGLVAIALVSLLLIIFEWQYRQRDGNKMELDQGNWQIQEYTPETYKLQGILTAVNETKKLDIFLTEVDVELVLLSKDSLEGITHSISITSRHPEQQGQIGRLDNYWESYIVKGKHSTEIEVEIAIKGQDLSGLETAWVKVHYVVYGPGGRTPKTRHCIIPLKFPDENAPKHWRSTTNADVLPIRTHLLSPLDSVVEVIRRYVIPEAQAGDIVTIGESPVAIIQGRWIHPSEVKPGWLAKRLCYYFLPTSSLATACGLQVLVDNSGAWQVGFAFIVGAIAKGLFKIPGVFYMLAGEQAKLIDDVTGTLPPYDQFIVLGPANSQAVVDEILAKTGLEAAIVDVNDLKRVAILAATPKATQEILNQALLNNPAGNAAEQTPVVLIRPVN
ncbi:hypothetical protein Syn7502_03565 [Synechococcus sp. PCC 7502]|uniref:hypothetical protein n=1 Tax=Synechococcus sp. PCC 7502 TaxID=1173263 RepID=UPI00029FFFAC|nr:hypothetical protein [Synechococcus sp. PCC 7502]AFY75402.1 hypothetical protein Syn7502_03565 [Synechococcus sp. PCC 7502]